MGSDKLRFCPKKLEWINDSNNTVVLPPELFYAAYTRDGEKTISLPTGTKFEKSKQVGGDHYSKLPIQPLEYALANGLGVMEHAVVKYTTRHKDKGGKQDLEKAIDYLHKMILHYYP